MATQNHTAYLRCYEELNDFLAPQRRKVVFPIHFNDKTSVKDLIESTGIPHTEIDLILVNGESVDFGYHVQPDDQISVYPVFEKLDITKVTKLRPVPLREIKFVLDGHLGKLAKYLRVLGFDTLYENNVEDDALALLSHTQQRILLTRDRELLKRSLVTHGHYVKQTNSVRQLLEIVSWLDLKQKIKPFTRCVSCNGELHDIDKSEIEHLLQQNTRKYYQQFKQCNACKKIYWKGSHYQKMDRLIKNLQAG